MKIEAKLRKLIELSEAIGAYEFSARALGVESPTRLLEYRQRQRKLIKAVLAAVLPERPKLTLPQVLDRLFQAWTWTVLATSRGKGR